MTIHNYFMIILGSLFTWTSTLKADQAWEDEGRLNMGDFSPLKEAYEKSDLSRLWTNFGLAANRQFYGGRTDAERKKAGLTKDQIIKLNQEIKDKAFEFLSRIPGHAKYLGDRIEAASNISENKNARIRGLKGLAELGTPEAIQQIGRFMFDDRCPEYNPAWSYEGSLRPHPNAWVAAAALNKALKDKSPSRSFGYFGPEAYAAIQAWWRSDASLPYRQQLPGVELPENVRNPPTAALIEARQKALDAKLRAISPEAGGEPLPWYITVLGLICVGGLTVWLGLHRRSPAPRPAKKAVADG